MKAKPAKRYTRGPQWFTFAELGSYRAQVNIETGDTRLLREDEIVQGTPKFRSSQHAADWIETHL